MSDIREFYVVCPEESPDVPEAIAAGAAFNKLSDAGDRAAKDAEVEAQLIFKVTLCARYKKGKWINADAGQRS